MSAAIAGISVSAIVGNLRVDRCPRLVLVSERHIPLSRGSMDLPDPDGALFGTIAVGQEAKITFGYRGAAPAAWSGQVASVSRGPRRDQVTVRMQGLAELPLVATPVTESWVDQSSESILRRVAVQVGLSVARLDSPGVVFPRFMAASLSLWQVARQASHTVQRANGMDMSAWALWLGADGLHWGDHDEPGDLPVIATGKGLIRHDPAVRGAGAWSEVETFLLPGFGHSRRFVLEDERRGISGDYRGQRVRHEVLPDRARTIIAYGEDHGRY
mgnify:CR=1 FL=1